MRPLALVSSLILLTAHLQADYKDEIGFTALQTFMGSSMIDGAGIRAGMVEASASEESKVYLPDVVPGDEILALSGASVGTSWHANMVSGYFFGPDSIAPALGNAVTGSSYPVHVHEANDWILNQLKLGNVQAPAVQTQDVVNFSWVGELSSEVYSTNALMRLDYSIQRDDYVAVVGVNNLTGNDVPLLSAAYNTINVGVSSGDHSYAPASGYGANKQRIHIVAPMQNTSSATAVVSASSALLLQAAKQQGYTSGLHASTIKSILMSGATKSQWLDHTYAKFGAGQVNVMRSYEILEAGQQGVKGSITELHDTKGWNSTNLGGGASQAYRIYTEDASEISVTLAWNALFNPTPSFNDTTLSLNNLDLKVYFSDVNTGDNGMLLTANASSSSGISLTDNVEHLWWDNRNAGYYTFMVQNLSAEAQLYSLSWLAIPEPSKALLVFFGSFILLLQRRRVLPD